MKKLLLLIGIVLIIGACNPKKQDHGTLTGTIKNIENGTFLNLVDYDSNKVIQQIIVKNGSFKISYSAPSPKAFFIRPENPKYEKDNFIVWLENSSTKMSGNFYNLADSKIEGSNSNNIYTQYKSIEENNKHTLDSLNKIRGMTVKQNILDSLTNESNKNQIEYRTKLMKFFSENISSEVAFYYLVFEIAKYNSVITKADLKQLYEVIPEKFKQSKDGLLIKNYLALPDIPKIGEKYIDLSQPTPSGKIESISNNLGKYTILEFWGSFCGGCRIEHPKLIKLYEKYHKRGLNIIGISGDDNLSDWTVAIAKDSIPWLSISDLQGYYNKGFLLYGVRSIPCLILLDKNGIILDNNLESKYIEGVLEKLF